MHYCAIWWLNVNAKSRLRAIEDRPLLSPTEPTRSCRQFHSVFCLNWTQTSWLTPSERWYDYDLRRLTAVLWPETLVFYAVVTCEIKLFWNNFEIINFSVFFVSRVTTSEIISKLLFQPLKSFRIISAILNVLESIHKLLKKIWNTFISHITMALWQHRC